MEIDISAKAREYQRSDESDGTTATAFENGAEWMREELTRWHDPNVVLPNDNKEVICTTNRRHNTFAVLRHDKYGWWQYVPFYSGGWCGYDGDVLGWREIL